MKNTSLVSIIIPVYNTAKYLPRCLNSVLNQTYQNLEIIIVDDGSTDNSPEIIKKYAAKDNRIKITHQKNAGLSAARNTGIAKATGKYISFVDSDDEISHNMIKKLFSVLQNNNADISVCSFKEVYSNGKVAHFSQNYPPRIYDTTEALQAMLQEHGFMVSATMKLFPTIYFKNIKFPIGKLHEDLGTTYALIMKAAKVSFIPDELYIYHHHNNSIVSAKNFDHRKFDIITLTDQMCNDIDHKYPELKNITNERRIRARFSILRQIPLQHPEVKNITNYLKAHQAYITKNPTATKADKIALKLALISPWLFQIAYKLFK